MIEQPLQTLEAWVTYFNSVEIPILRQTRRRLEEARQNIDRITGRDIAAIVLQDPLLTIRVLAFIQPFRGKHLQSDITTIANAVMMLGVEPFFRRFEEPQTVEEVLRDEPQALLGVLHVIRRVQRASRYAHDWAFERHDWNVEEVALAALLHDLAEILLCVSRPGWPSKFAAASKPTKRYAAPSRNNRCSASGFSISSWHCAMPGTCRNCLKH